MKGEANEIVDGFTAGAWWTRVDIVIPTRGIMASKSKLGGKTMNLLFVDLWKLERYSVLGVSSTQIDV